VPPDPPRQRAQSMPPLPDSPAELIASGATFKDAKERWVATFERDYIFTTLRKNTGNISHAAREADIDRKYFRKLMRKYDIDAAGRDDEPDE
jgi:DNA-binding NtrC family response regulator